MSGKGDRRIPAQVPDKQVEDNWNKIFGKKKKKNEKQTLDSTIQS